MKDITKPNFIEVLISNDGKKLWINGEFGCILRASHIGKIYLRDKRDKK